MKKCYICGKQRFAYRYYKSKLVPICDDCYEKYISRQDKFELLIARLTNKGYVWILGLGKINFPYTLFGLDVTLDDIVTFIKDHLGIGYELEDKESCCFLFDDYDEPVVVENILTFRNDNDYIDFNVRLGLYNFDNNEILFFTDKQMGLKKSHLDQYSSVAYDADGIYRLEADTYNSIRDDDYEDPFNKEYLDENDITSMIGFFPE